MADMFLIFCKSVYNIWWGERSALLWCDHSTQFAQNWQVFYRVLFHNTVVFADDNGVSGTRLGPLAYSVKTKGTDIRTNNNNRDETEKTESKKNEKIGGPYG